jgi:membrane protease YdiL (CAAX protease family)
MEEQIKSAFTLKKLIYALAVLAIVSAFEVRYLDRMLIMGAVDREQALAREAVFGYPAEALIHLVALAGVICAYWRSLLFGRYRAIQTTQTTWKSGLFGLATGVAVSIVAGLGRNSDALLQRGIVFGALLWNPERVFGIASLLLIAIALPVVGEAFYRGIVLRTLTEYTTMPAAILGSSILFACIFPLYSPATRLVFGVLAGGLFYWARNLIAPTVASVALSFSLLVSVLLRSLR